MRSVFTATFQQLQRFQFVELIIAGRISQAIQARRVLAASIDHDVQTVEGVQQALGFADVDVQRFNPRRRGIANRRRRDAIQSAILIAHNQPALWVDGHADPRALRLFRHGIDEFHAEAGQHLQASRIGGGIRRWRRAAVQLERVDVQLDRRRMWIKADARQRRCRAKVDDVLRPGGAEAGELETHGFGFARVRLRLGSPEEL